MSQLVHHFATLREVKVHYVTAGAGHKTLVLLHGYPQSWYCWRHVIAELQNEYSIVAPDLRGLGDTTRPAGGFQRSSHALLSFAADQNDAWGHSPTPTCPR
jgi:pimeloyl-ACP methyl ester carboxylesterase